MRAARRAAMIVLLMMLAAPGLGASAEAEAAKPKSKACKKGMLKVKTGKTARCVKVRLAPPAPKPDADAGKQALELVLSSRWPALKDRRGRTVRSPAQELARVGHGATAKLRKAFTKGFALAASGRPKATAAKRSAATATAAAAAGEGGVTGVSDGDTLGFDGDIPAGDFRIAVQFRSNEAAGGFRGVRCPTAAGLLKGDTDVTMSIAIRITAGDRLIMASSTTMTDVAHYEAHMADDAKLDTLDVDHSGRLSATTEGAGHSRLALRVQAHRTAQVDMRSHNYTNGNRELEVRADLAGAPPAVAAALAAQVTSRLTAGTDAAFSRVVGTGMGQYTIMQSEINQPGRCVHMEFEPLNPQQRYAKGATGTFTSSMKPNADPGNRAPGRWAIAAIDDLQITPDPATGTTPSFTFTVTNDIDREGYVNFRATSKAGVAINAQTILIETGAPRWRVTGLVYTDSLSADGFAPLLGCAASAGQTNTTTFAPSGREFDGAISPPIPEPLGHGEQTGLITATGTLQKVAAFSGCQWNDDVSARVPCQRMSSGAEKLTLVLEVYVPEGIGAAVVTWHLRPPVVGDVPPVVGVCEYGGAGVGPEVSDTIKTEVPRQWLFDAGAHTLAVDWPYEGPGGSGVGTVHSNAHYKVTIDRL